MKTQWIAVALGVACFTACDSPEKSVEPKAETKTAPPIVFLIEAESLEILGEKYDDVKASGSAGVKRQFGSQEPVIVCDIPASQKPLSVWLHRKGGALRISTSADGNQGKDRWASESEEQYVWSSFGEIPPGAERRQLIAIGSDRKDEAVFVDCILFSAGTVENKDALLTPLPAVSIDITKTTGTFRSAPKLWGLNLMTAGDPKTLSERSYTENLSYLSPKMVRIQTSGELDVSGENRYDFLDPETKTWDEQKVRAVVSETLELTDAGEIMINIPNWPEWMDTDKDDFLDEDKFSEYAELVGRFAEIIWEFPAARERVLFEISDGRDFLYHSDLVADRKPHRISELARIFLTCADRIRKVAPGARIGAPSVAEPFDTIFHEQFIALTAPRLDFYSMQFYASGNPRDSDSRILSLADSVIQPLESVKEVLRKNSKDREIPVSVNEYNISWNKEPAEPRMANGFGAVWDAWFMLSLFSAGADSAAAWSDNDKLYGKFSPEGERRPSANIYHVLNAEFSGPIARLETDEQEDIAALTTESGNRILISHRALREREIILPEGKWSGWMIGKGVDDPRKTKMQGKATLPGISVLYLEKE